MVEVTPIQTNFTAGEFSPRLRGRVDISGYYNACRTLQNMIPFVHGGVTHRQGTRHVAEVKDSSKKTRLIPFKFSTEQNYIIELGDEYMRVYRAQGQVIDTTYNISAISQANPCQITTSASNGVTTGEQVILSGIVGMTELNGNRYTVTKNGSNTFTLDGVDSTGFTAYSSGGTVDHIFEIATPWGESDLDLLKFTQSADVLYVVHPDYAPREITRTADDAWTVSEYEFKDGPYLDLNTTSTTMTPSGTTGNITITASSATFASTDVGRLIRIQTSGTWGYAEITAFTSATSVSATVKSNLGGTGAVDTWRLGAWSDTTGWPQVITFFQERLMFGGTATQPQTFWGSKSSDFTNFAPTDTSGTVSDSSGVTFTIADDQVNAIQWMKAGRSLLIIGTTEGEHLAYGGNAAGALIPVTPTNIAISREGPYGSVDDVRPVSVGNGGVVFVQRSRRRVRHMKFNAAINSYIAEDITLRAEHITKGGFEDSAFQQEIDPKMWFVRADGTLVGCTFDEAEEVIAWHRHILGGSFSDGQAVVESVSVIPDPTTTLGDNLWLIVKRTINGATKRYVEYLTQDYSPDENGVDSAIFMDSSLTYNGYDQTGTVTPAATTGTGVTFTASGTPFDVGMVGNEIHYRTVADGLLGKAVITAYNSSSSVDCDIVVDFPNTNAIAQGSWAITANTVSGIDHLEGEVIQVCADGAQHPNRTVVNGAISLNDEYAKVHVGLYADAIVELFPAEAEQVGTIQARRQRIVRANILFYQTLGAKFGASINSLEQILWRAGSDPMDAPPPLFTGWKRLPFPKGYDNEPAPFIVQPFPLPMTILAVTREMEVNA